MAEVTIHPLAEEEYEAALAWYMDRSNQTAKRFEVAFGRAIESIASTPETYPFCDEIHRFSTVSRFPCSLIYRCEGSGAEVVAVAHVKRRPRYWTGR